MGVFYINANELNWLAGPFTVFSDSPALFVSGTFVNPSVGIVNAAGFAPTVGQVKRVEGQIGVANAIGFAPSVTTFQSKSEAKRS